MRPRWPATQTRLPSRSDSGAHPSPANPILRLRKGHADLHQIGLHHRGHEFREGDRRCPAEILPSVGRIGNEGLDLGRSEVSRIHLDVGFPIDPHATERGPTEVPHRVPLTGADHIVARLNLLEHPVHRLDVVLRVSPVANHVQVAQVDAVLLP